MVPIACLRRDTRPLDLRGFRWIPASPPPGTYASWVSRWEPFSGSRTEAAIDRIVAATQGRERAVFDALLTALGIPGQPLAVSPFSLYLETPDGGPAVLSASWEKGLRLHFPASASFATMGDAWEAFAQVVERARTGRSPPGPGGMVPGDWWRVAKRAMATPAHGTRFEAFGLLHHPQDDVMLFADAIVSSSEGLAPAEFAADPGVLKGRMPSHVRLRQTLKMGGFMPAHR